tara:strand:+ start:1021 stop:1617 length:597 start_codon:yes stop_codon:yes gene_type:complete
MKKTYLLISSLLISLNIFSQIQYSQSNITNQSFIKNLSGPRVGFTIISDGELKDNLISEFGLTSSIISQFGYQFEKQIMGDENIAGLVEGIVFLGGLEHGLFLPSLSGMFGARFSSGYEFAIGPNLSLGGAGLVLGFGKTIEAGNINIPINFAWVPSTSRQNTISNFDFENGDYTEEIETVRTGNRFTLTIGFNFMTK